jgi:Localisation of periplasmic protein complexes.
VINVGETGMNKSKLKKMRLTALAVFGAALYGQSFAEMISLDDIDFTALPGNEFEMELEFSSQPPQPESYTLDSPARIVLDFPGVESSLAKKKHPLSFENAQSAVVLTADGKTRVIINLNQMTTFQPQVVGNSFNLRIGGVGATVYSGGSESGFSAPVSTKTSSRTVTDVDFSRGEAGEGLVKLQLSDPHVSVDVQQVGSKIQLSLF